MPGITDFATRWSAPAGAIGITDYSIYMMRRVDTAAITALRCCFREPYRRGRASALASPAAMVMMPIDARGLPPGAHMFFLY